MFIASSRYELRCFAAAAIISVIVAVTMNLIPVALIRLFLTDATGAFLAEAVLALRIVSLGFLARWMVMSVQAMLVALSQPRLSSLLSICTSMVFPLMLIVALQPLGLTGLWLNNPCSTLLAAALGAFLLVYFRRELRQGKVRVGR
jgi:Na+-driven multidrug efflux pump